MSDAASDTAAFFEAIRAGDEAGVERMLGHDPALLGARNAQGVSAVLLACYTGRKEIRDLLIERGAELALHEAVASGRLDRARQFAESDSALAREFSPDGFPLVALAAAFGHDDVVRYLHGKGADINSVATNGTGYTALTGAINGGHAGIAKWLVENGADLNYRYAKGYSPFLAAAANGQLEILKMLFSRGADPNARTDDGKNALNFAEERKHDAVADYLRGLGLTA
jgi:ankyrin repeat protein